MIRAILVGVITAIIFMVAGYGQTPSKADLLKTIEHIEALAKQTQTELDAEKQANAQEKIALSDAQKNLIDVTSQFASYKKAAETEIQKGNNAIVSLANLVKKHHLDLIILIGLWVGFVGLLYLKAGTMLGPAGIYIAAGLAVAGVVFIMFRL